jgi:hypothetical protein
MDNGHKSISRGKQQTPKYFEEIFEILTVLLL